jgi:predicted MPP superfamily phosphohydrolase
MDFSKKAGSLVVDVACTLSVAGIWPRFIEPKMLKVSKLSFDFPTLKPLKVIHLTDLHFHEKMNLSFLRKIAARVRIEEPDLLVFTGDFICFSRLEKENVLKDFLLQLKARYGSFCTFGNHDYASYVTRNRQGDYVVAKPINPLMGFFKGMRTLFSANERIGTISEEASVVGHHERLVSLLRESNFTVLENQTVTFDFGLNLVGLGDYAAGKFNPERAFSQYDKRLPGLVLSHNPDTFPLLAAYPGELVLAGHSHGEQIHFPGPLRALSKRLTRLENPHLARGLISNGNKKLYVSRGLGCHKPLRFLSPPEMVVMTLGKDSHDS